MTTCVQHNANMAFHTRALLCLLALLLFKGCCSQNVPSSSACGRVETGNTNVKIVGGHAALPGSWPWQASIHRHNALGHFCGGSLINREWVLSAAHCFPPEADNQMSSLTVFLGRHAQGLVNPHEVNRTVAQIYRSPDANVLAERDSDIVMLKLSSPVNFTRYVRPVCLAAMGSTFHDGTMSWATGWGATHDNASGTQMLQEVNVEVVGNNQCGCDYDRTESVEITDNMLCAGRGKGPCQGDDGGPLVTLERAPDGTQLWVLSGVASFGSRAGCREPNLPGVYTRVSRYQRSLTTLTTNDPIGFVQFTSLGPDPDADFECLAPPPPVKPCESLFCGGPNTVHFSYFTYVLTLALMLYSLAGFA